jgi:hypothetical protein
VQCFNFEAQDWSLSTSYQRLFLDLVSLVPKLSKPLVFQSFQSLSCFSTVRRFPWLFLELDCDWFIEARARRENRTKAERRERFRKVASSNDKWELQTKEAINWR